MAGTEIVDGKFDPLDAEPGQDLRRDRWIGDDRAFGDLRDQRAGPEAGFRQHLIDLIRQSRIGQHQR